MGQSEKHYDFPLRKVYVFNRVGALDFVNGVSGSKIRNALRKHYVKGVGGLKIRIALRKHYECGWVGHIDRNEHYVVYGQPLSKHHTVSHPMVLTKAFFLTFPRKKKIKMVKKTFVIYKKQKLRNKH